MRQPKNNRRFYWLPLLCVIWTVSASAQTWTTVWTPDSAPAAKTTTKDGTHESKTNCYPCKEWEDYGDNKGKWVNYPEGTEPVICDDDDTDYTCKECDGEGGVRNKADGTGCATGSINDGCCYAGECIDPQPLQNCEEVDNCPNLIPIPGFTPVPTTPPCGPLIGGLPALPSYFNRCCIVHDLCYARCGSDRGDCDEVFIGCMTDICNGRTGWAQRRCFWLRNRARNVFIDRDLGRDSWCDRQIEGCLCCGPVS